MDINMKPNYKKIYEKITDELNFSRSDDIKSRDIVYSILKQKRDYNFKEIINNIKRFLADFDNILIFGGGEDSSNLLDLLKKNNALDILRSRAATKNGKSKICVISIDGQTRLLLENSVVPDIIFTDLDGILDETFYDLLKLQDAQELLKSKKVVSEINTSIDINTASNKNINVYGDQEEEFLEITDRKDIRKDMNKKASTLPYIIIHAHGDNIKRIQGLKDFIVRYHNIIITTQNKSKKPVLNFGGFTDGDRALYFIKKFIHEDQDIFLIGYDFGDYVGAYSKPDNQKVHKAGLIKRKKMDFGVMLLVKVLRNLSNNVFFIQINGAFNSELKKYLKELSTFDYRQISLFKSEVVKNQESLCRADIKLYKFCP
ncbi:MAG: hypothetical protein ACTSU2_07110 [Promethearchaeota archaeon]